MGSAFCGKRYTNFRVSCCKSCRKGCKVVNFSRFFTFQEAFYLADFGESTISIANLCHFLEIITIKSCFIVQFYFLFLAF